MLAPCRPGMTTWVCIRGVLGALLVVGFLSVVARASSGDDDIAYKSCVHSCLRAGCVGHHCIPGCKSTDEDPNVTAIALQPVTGPWELASTKWDCGNECKYQCMVVRETSKGTGPGIKVEKYHGKWPFRRIYGIQEPASVIFSILNLIVNAYGLARFRYLVFTKLQRKPMGDKGPLYDYAGLWNVYGLVVINSWMWSAIFHARDTKWTEAWDYSSAIALVGYSLVLAVIRAGSLRLEAARVIVSAPIIAFTATHILYLNYYEFDYGWNMKVCLVMGGAQLLLWLSWSAMTRHKAVVTLWAAVIGTILSMGLEVYDFPPWKGVLDAHALWHASTIPLSFLWWSFVNSDAIIYTELILKKPLRTKETDAIDKKKD